MSSFKCRPGLASEHKFEPFKDSRDVREFFSSSGGGPVLTSSCSPRKKKSIAPHSVPHSPQPPRYAKGASLFVPESSRAFLSSPRTMHEEIRTGPPYDSAISILYCRKAQRKITGSFCDPRAYDCSRLRYGLERPPQMFLCLFEPLHFHRRVGRLIDPAANGRSAWRDQGSFFPPLEKTIA